MEKAWFRIVLFALTVAMDCWTPAHGSCRPGELNLTAATCPMERLCGTPSALRGLYTNDDDHHYHTITAWIDPAAVRFKHETFSPSPFSLVSHPPRTDERPAARGPRMNQ